MEAGSSTGRLERLSRGVGATQVFPSHPDPPGWIGLLVPKKKLPKEEEEEEDEGFEGLEVS